MKYRLCGFREQPRWKFYLGLRLLNSRRVDDGGTRYGGRDRM